MVDDDLVTSASLLMIAHRLWHVESTPIWAKSAEKTLDINRQDGKFPTECSGSSLATGGWETSEPEGSCCEVLRPMCESGDAGSLHPEMGRGLILIESYKVWCDGQVRSTSPGPQPIHLEKEKEKRLIRRMLGG